MGQGLDTDGDGYSNLKECIADTNPNDMASLFKLIDIDSVSATSHIVQVSFAETSDQRVYSLYYKTNLLSGSWMPLFTNVPGAPGMMTLIDTNDIDSIFYRVNVEVP